MQLLQTRGVRVKARVQAIAGIRDMDVDLATPPLDAIAAEGLPTVSPDAARRMAEAILAAKSAGDSVGGVVELSLIHI